MILINNRQRKIKVNSKDLQAKAEKMLAVLGYKDFDLGILLTTNKSIHTFNKTYRHKDKPTDILSFPYHPELKAGEKITIASPDDKNLGDLIISLEYVQKDAKKTWSRTFDDHLIALLAHGIAHLLGYDHIIDKDYIVMLKIEKKLLASVGLDRLLNKLV